VSLMIAGCFQAGEPASSEFKFLLLL